MATLMTGQDARDLFARFEEDWERLLGWSRYPGSSGLFDQNTFPAFDVVETEEGCTVWADVPGLDRKDLDVSITANVLTIQGEKKDEVRANDERLHRDETWSGSFRRSIALPDTVDPDQVQAEYKDGVLKVTVARKPEHKPRQIAVQAR